MFELLDPHKQFISPETRTGILAVRDSAALHGPESGKKYVMQVYVWTWPFMMKTEAIDDLERRWERWGKLETGTVKSDFFDIVVPHLQNPAQCEPDR